MIILSVLIVDGLYRNSCQRAANDQRPGSGGADPRFQAKSKRSRSHRLHASLERGETYRGTVHDLHQALCADIACVHESGCRCAEMQGVEPSTKASLGGKNPPRR